jgi:hypothetical protein
MLLGWMISNKKSIAGRISVIVASPFHERWAGWRRLENEIICTLVSATHSNQIFNARLMIGRLFFVNCNASLTEAILLRAVMLSLIRDGTRAAPSTRIYAHYYTPCKSTFAHKA